MAAFIALMVAILEGTLGIMVLWPRLMHRDVEDGDESVAANGTDVGRLRELLRRIGSKPRPSTEVVTASTPDAAAQSPPETPPPPPHRSQPIAGGTGRIVGTVRWVGPPRHTQLIKRNSDPFCAKTQFLAEELVVNANGTIANVLVEVEHLQGHIIAPGEPATITVEQCMYRPRLQAIVAGQALHVHSADPVLHWFHSYEGSRTLSSGVLLGTTGPDMALGDWGSIIKFKCDVHPWETGFVAVISHPFFAVTDTTGSFEIGDLPPGTYSVAAWQERLGWKRGAVTIKADQPSDLTFTYDGTEKP